MTKQLTITLDDWVEREILQLSKHKNKSARVQELLIKAHIAQQLENERSLQLGKNRSKANVEEEEEEYCGGRDFVSHWAFVTGFEGFPVLRGQY